MIPTPTILLVLIANFSFQQKNNFSLPAFLEKWICVEEQEKRSYRRPDYVPLAVWEKVEGKLLPHNHPIKKKLDKIFTKEHVNKNGQTLFEAGFLYIPFRRQNNLIVALHAKLQGYLIKTYTDEVPQRNAWKNWLDRIFGAELIAEFLNKQNYLQTFKVPKKWIYPIPYNCENNVGQPFLLVVEDMEVTNFLTNRKKWRKEVTKKILTQLYHIIETLGLLDSVYIDNIPFSKDGKIAFVDTEHTLKWPVPYHKLNHRLSDSNQIFWNQLIAEVIYPEFTPTRIHIPHYQFQLGNCIFR